MRKPLKVGTYYLGRDSIELWIREDRGGSCEVTQPHGALRKMEIGVDDCFNQAVGTIVHEASEYCQAIMGCRYLPWIDTSDDTPTGVIIMTHAEFSELSARVGGFLADCLPDFARAYKKWTKVRETRK